LYLALFTTIFIAVLLAVRLAVGRHSHWIEISAEGAEMATSISEPLLEAALA
jgi:hypothetical protein